MQVSPSMEEVEIENENVTATHSSDNPAETATTVKVEDEPKPTTTTSKPKFVEKQKSTAEVVKESLRKSFPTKSKVTAPQISLGSSCAASAGASGGSDNPETEVETSVKHDSVPETLPGSSQDAGTASAAPKPAVVQGPEVEYGPQQVKPPIDLSNWPQLQEKQKEIFQ